MAFDRFDFVSGEFDFKEDLKKETKAFGVVLRTLPVSPEDFAFIDELWELEHFKEFDLSILFGRYPEIIERVLKNWRDDVRLVFVAPPPTQAPIPPVAPSHSQATTPEQAHIKRRRIAPDDPLEAPEDDASLRPRSPGALKHLLKHEQACAWAARTVGFDLPPSNALSVTHPPYPSYPSSEGLGFFRPPPAYSSPDSSKASALSSADTSHEPVALTAKKT